MNLELPVEEKELIESLVAAGRFSSLSEAISAGIRLLVSQERLKQELEVGVAQADRGELVDHDTVFAQLRMMAAAASDTQGRQ